MENNYPNKMMGASEDQITVKAASPMMNEYHFAGSGKWKPMSVKSTTIESATAIWQKTRVLVAEKTQTPKDDTPADESKVAETETNNE